MLAGLFLAGCRDQPQHLLLRDSLTEKPIHNALVMIELEPQLLEYLATLLRDIVTLPAGGGTYKEFPGARALARKHLQRLHELYPAIPPPPEEE